MEQCYTNQHGTGQNTTKQPSKRALKRYHTPSPQGKATQKRMYNRQKEKVQGSEGNTQHKQHKIKQTRLSKHSTQGKQNKGGGDEQH